MKRPPFSRQPWPMFVIIIFAVLAVRASWASAEATAATASKVAGTWKVAMAGEHGTVVEETLILRQEGEAVTGTWKDAEIENGRYRVPTLKFRITRPRVTMDYVGTLTGDTMRGHYIFKIDDGSSGRVEWKAEREPAPVTGTWKLRLKGRAANQAEQMLILSQTGERINGTLAAEQLQNGTYKARELTFLVTRPGGTTEYTATVSEDNMKGRSSLQPTEGAVVRTEFMAQREPTPPKATLKGRLVDKNASPVVGVQVSCAKYLGLKENGEANLEIALNWGDLSRAWSDTTDAQGRFTITGLEPGKYAVEAQRCSPKSLGTPVCRGLASLRMGGGPLKTFVLLDVTAGSNVSIGDVLVEGLPP